MSKENGGCTLRIGSIWLLISLVLLILKVTGTIDIAWIWVFVPILWPFVAAISILGTIVAVIIAVCVIAFVVFLVVVLSAKFRQDFSKWWNGK